MVSTMSVLERLLKTCRRLRATAALVVIATAAQAAPPITEAAFSHDFRTVFSTVLGVFANQKVPLSLVSRERGLIRTGSVDVPQARLRQLVLKQFEVVVDKQGRQGGRFLLELTLSGITEKETKVAVKAMIVLTTESLSPAGGQIVPSNGTLETELLMALAKALRSR